MGPLQVEFSPGTVTWVTESLVNAEVGQRVLVRFYSGTRATIMGVLGGSESVNPGEIVINGTAYATSGRTTNIPTFSWDYTDPPIYRVTIAVPVPYTPPDGYSFNWSGAHASAFVLAGNATYSISGGTQRVRVLQLGSSGTDRLSALNWQLVKL